MGGALSLLTYMLYLVPSVQRTGVLPAAQSDFYDSCLRLVAQEFPFFSIYAVLAALLVYC